ncbi:MAG: DUF1360 domain-containing protein [Phycisphaerales bacterium]
MLDMPWMILVLAVLATWRVAHLVAFEDGPWDVIVRLRRRAGTGMLGRLMDCPYCIGVWAAAAFALPLSGSFAGWLLAWWGVAGGAAIIERVTARDETGRTTRTPGNP